ELADVSEPLESENTEQIEQDEIAEDTDSGSIENDLEFPANTSSNDELDDGLNVDLDLSGLDKLCEDENIEADDQEAESTPASEENPESIESLDTLEEKEAEETSKANMPSDDLENLGDLEDSKELGDVEDSTNLENLENMEEADMPTDEVDSQTAEATEDLAGLDDLGESVAEEASLESGDDLEVTQEVESDEMSADTALDENKELADVSEPLESENTEQIEQDEIAEDTSNDLLNDVEALALDETPQEEESTQSPETILDKDQVDEVSQALHSLDESAQVDNGEDFIALKEPDVAQALGEKIDMPEPELEQDTIEENDLSTEDLAEDELEQNLQDESPQANTNISTQEAKNSNESSQEFVKNMIASSVQSSITSLHTDNLKSMLDGLEVTINISFKDKSK
ncbi:MAG: hypothetical protein K2N45_04565, partial [Helicobacter japonicus]|nr:hypothetical protein [Helicobacter japonicus]